MALRGTECDDRVSDYRALTVSTLLPVEGVVALLLAEDPLAVGGVLVWVLVVLPVELREADGEGEQDQQEQAQELPKLLQHLAHGDLLRDQKERP